MVGKAFGILPTDLRLRSLSRFQILWLYVMCKRDEAIKNSRSISSTKLVCSFINPEAAKKMFDDREVIETSDEEFERLILEKDPDFDMDTFKKMMGD